jgi:L-ascorbate metabolism protein UlaG (beta-lactamase superfamily)
METGAFLLMPIRRRTFLRRSGLLAASLCAGLTGQSSADELTWSPFSFIKNSDLPCIKPDFPGNAVLRDQFVDTVMHKHAFFSVMRKWVISGNSQAREKKQDPYQVPFLEFPAIPTNGPDQLVWLGHSSFFARVAGKNLLFDPCLVDIFTRKRHVPSPLLLDALRNIDYVLVSHGHRDHLDTATVRKIRGGRTRAMVPLRMTAVIKDMNPELTVQEAGWYQKYSTEKDLEVFFLPARHWHKRALFDTNKILWGSFLIRTPRVTIFYAGDTGYGQHFKEIRQFFPKIDYAIMPIGAYKPPFIMQNHHLNPEEAVQAANDLGAKVFIPMHYGTYDLSFEPPGEPIRFLQELQARKAFNGDIKIPAAGEVLLL